MQFIGDAIGIEFMKARHSRVPGLTLLGFSLAPLTGGLFMKILLDPTWAQRFGAMTVRAKLSATVADWSTYFGILTQAVAVGGLILFGFIVIWVFGREYSDRTMKDLLAVPISRQAIVTAKFLVIFGWTSVLTLWIYVLGLGLGLFLGLPHWTADVALSATLQLFAIAALTFILVVPLAWIASAGQGYLVPFGALILVMFLAQVSASLGWGAYFPWAVPSLLSGAAGPSAQSLGLGSYVLVVLAGSIGLFGTVAWWRYADQT